MFNGNTVEKYAINWKNHYFVKCPEGMWMVKHDYLQIPHDVDFFA